MTAFDVITRTRTYIMENFLYTRPDYHVAERTSLLEGGIIDSMGVMELVQFIEQAFGVEVADDEITEENLGSLAAIGAFVSARREGARATATVESKTGVAV